MEHIHLPGATPLNKTHSSSLSSYQLPRGPQLGMGRVYIRVAGMNEARAHTQITIRQLIDLFIFLFFWKQSFSV